MKICDSAFNNIQKSDVGVSLRKIKATACIFLSMEILKQA